MSDKLALFECLMERHLSATDRKRIGIRVNNDSAKDGEFEQWHEVYPEQENKSIAERGDFAYFGLADDVAILHKTDRVFNRREAAEFVRKYVDGFCFDFCEAKFVNVEIWEDDHYQMEYKVTNNGKITVEEMRLRD